MDKQKELKTEINNDIQEEIKKPEIPFEVALEDTKEVLIKVINASNLPICIVVNMLSDITSQYNVIAKEITNKKRAEYKEQLFKWESSQDKNI